jgi:general stress protein 26
MRTQAQRSADLQGLADKLKDQRVVMLTTPDDLGTLSSRPMTPQEMDANGAVWMMVSRKAPWVQHAAGQPVNLAFVLPDDGDYISIAGRSELVDDATRKKELWTVVARPWWSGAEDADLMLLKVSPVRIEVWDGPDSAVSRTLAIVASVIAGREVGLGDKQVIEPISAQSG